MRDPNGSKQFACFRFGSPWWKSMMKDREIRRSREGLIEKGTVAIALRKVVAASWRSSQGQITSVERKGAPLALEAELVQCCSAHSALLEAARAAMEEARLFLAQANAMIILTDPSGLILETA